MTFVEEMVSIRIPARIYRDNRNKGKKLDSKSYVSIEKETDYSVAYFNGEWYDVTAYIRKAADEIGNVGRVNNKDHSEICGKYADLFIKDVLAGKVGPVDISSVSKRKRAAAEA